MAKTFASIQEQIQKLQQQAAVLRAKEAAGVIARIKEAIMAYELTPADLFGTSTANTHKASNAKTTAKKVKAKKTSGKSNMPIKYTDGTNSWVGHGKRPKWFVDALAAGKTPDDMLISKNG